MPSRRSVWWAGWSRCGPPSPVTPDLLEAYDLLDESDRIQGGIKRNLTRESGGTEESLQLHSAVHAPSPIRVPTLILHGEDDQRVRAENARELAEILRKAGTPVELAIFLGVGHRIPSELRKDHVERFLERIWRR